MAPAHALIAMFAVAKMASMVAADYDMIAGYTPNSDVEPHSLLDLDMEEIEMLSDDFNFTGAYELYANGKNSLKTDSIRTIRGFSTSAEEKLSGEKWFGVYEAYWGKPDYADLFTSAACLGTGDFEDAADVTRAECCTKGAQYQNIWMYVIHELEDAINDCEIGDLNANDGGPHAWDEGWAFWSGSLEGEDGSGDGVMGYALADKRCTQFGTCTGDDDGNEFAGTSAVNHDLLELYEEGMAELLSENCGDVEDIKEKIVKLMTVPLIQGLLRYVYLADPNGGNGGDKEAAELWAFSAAVLPQINECDEDVADFIRSNTDITSSYAPIADGHVEVKEKLESVYSCMGIKCSQVGGLLIEGMDSYYNGFEPCSDSDSDEVKAWEIAVAVLTVVIVLAILVYLWVRCRRRREANATARSVDSGLGGFEGTSTL